VCLKLDDSVARKKNRREYRSKEDGKENMKMTDDEG